MNNDSKFNTHIINMVWFLSITSMLLLVAFQAWHIYSMFVAETTRQFNQKMNVISQAVSNIHTPKAVYIGSADDADNIISKLSTPTSKIATDTLYIDNIPPEQLYTMISRMSGDIKNSLSPVKYDSILATHDIYATDLSIQQEDLHEDYYTSSYSWHQCRMHFHVIINPILKKSLTGTVTTKVDDMLVNIRYPIILSLLVIFVLTICFCYTIKTIKWQMKINEMRSNIIITMIHELRRPLQSLKTFISFLRNKEMRTDEQMTQQVIDDSTFELDNMSAYLASTREMACGNMESTPLNISRFDINQLVTNVVRLANEPPNKHVIIKTSFSQDEIMVNADQVHMANCIRNLVENSIKYSNDTVNIDINTATDDKHCFITVIDDGWGILANERNLVFEPFTRSPRFNRSEIPGLGLGLNYVRNIIQMHGGSVCINNVTTGTSITIKIPLT